MKNYHIKLDMFNGPLDLLLYLIKREEVEIYDIPVAKISKQYLEHVRLIQDLNVDNASEFLVMAAALLELKSAMLIPKTIEEGDEEEIEDDFSDPRMELVKQLLEYKKFKDAAYELEAKEALQSQKYPRSLLNLNKIRKDEASREKEYDLEGLHVWDLFDAFNSISSATLSDRKIHEVHEDDTPIDVYETSILTQAQTNGSISFKQTFAQCKSRIEMVGLFLALLELMRQKLVRIEQADSFSDIEIFPLTQEDAKTAVAHALSSDLETLASEKMVDQKNQGLKASDEDHANFMLPNQNIKELSLEEIAAETQAKADEKAAQKAAALAEAEADAQAVIIENEQHPAPQFEEDDLKEDLENSNDDIEINNDIETKILQDDVTDKETTQEHEVNNG